MKKIIWTFSVMLCLLMTGCGNEQKNTGMTCTILVDCSEVLNHTEDLQGNLKDYIPKDGKILKETRVEIEKDDTVYDVLKRTLKENNILMEASFTGDLAYVEGIDNLYEFSCGELSGWMYCVNGKYPNVGCSSYKVKNGDKIEWHYTCNLGSDLGQQYTGDK